MNPRGSLSILRVAGLIAFALAVSVGSTSPSRARAAGPVYQIDPGDAKFSSVAEYPNEGRLYAMYTNVLASGDFALRLATAPSNGETWSVVGTFPDAGARPNQARLLVDNGGIMHAIWSDDAGSGAIFHGWFTPNAGSSPADLANWRVERIDNGAGKNPSVTIDRGTGSLYVVWDDIDARTVYGRKWTAAGGWGSTSNLTAASKGGTCATPCSPALVYTPDGRLHLVHVDAGRYQIYDQFDTEWNYIAGSYAVLSGTPANHPAQLVAEPSSAVDIVWSQGGGPNGVWEVYYSRRAADGVWNGGGVAERVSRNIAGTIDRYPAIALDRNGNPHVAWSGDGAGPAGFFQIYERVRGAASDPWPDYGDPATFCVSCGSGGDAELPRYGFSFSNAVHLTFVQDTGGRNWSVRYAPRADAPPAPAGPAPRPPKAPPFPAPLPPAPVEGGWFDWQSLGGTLVDAPAAAALRDTVYLFVRGSDNGLYYRSSTDRGTSWGAWQYLGGVLSGAPAATTYNGRVYVFVAGTGGELYYRRADVDGGFREDWQTLGGTLTAPPAAASDGANLYVFGRGTDNGLFARRFVEGEDWGPWYSLGGTLTAAPGAAGFGNQVGVFVKGGGDALYQRRSVSPDRFGDWQLLGGTLTAAPTAAATVLGGQATLAVFVTGTDGQVYERRTLDGEGFADWRVVGGLAVGPPTAAGARERFVVAVRGTNDALWERHTQP